MQAHPWPRPRKWQLTQPLAFLLVAVFTDVNCLGILNLLHFYDLYRHRTAENNQRLLSHAFNNILFGDYALGPCRPIPYRFFW